MSPSRGGDSGWGIVTYDPRIGDGIAWGILSGGTNWCGGPAYVFFSEIKRAEARYGVYAPTFAN